MTNVRGFVNFEDRNLNQIKESLKDFNIPGISYKFFNGLLRLEKEIDMPGLLLDGEVDLKEEDEENYSEKIIRLLRIKVGLLEELIHCDVSSAVGGEDYMGHLKKGNLEGKYVAVRIWPPYPETKEPENFALDLGSRVNANDVLLRGIERIIYKDEEIPKRCIDLTGQIDFELRKKKIEDYLESKELILEGYTLIDLPD